MRYSGAVCHPLPVNKKLIREFQIVYLFLKVPLYRYLKKDPPDGWLRRCPYSGGSSGRSYTSPHRRHGSSFVLVTPGQNELWCADSAMAQIILARRKDFVQSPMAIKIMSFQGSEHPHGKPEPPRRPQVNPTMKA